MTEITINEPWVSTKEIAEHLGVTMGTVRKWIKIEVDAWIKSGGAAEEKIIDIGQNTGRNYAIFRQQRINYRRNKKTAFRKRTFR